MKLILCKNCGDIVTLIQDKERFCECGKCSGKYTDELNAWYKGDEFVVPLGVAYGSLANVVMTQPESGMGKNFSAFVIPKQCNTFEKK